MKKFAIKNKYVILVDDNDYEIIKDFKMFIGVNKKYVMFIKDGKRYYLHRFLLDVNDSNIVVDHINGNPYDNRRLNLRLCTKKDNVHNIRVLSSHNTSGFKGVSFDKYTNKWRAQIHVNRKSIKLGRFSTKEEAAIAYDKAAKMYFGNFSCTNKMLGLLDYTE